MLRATLDIEHLFGLVSGSKRTSVLSVVPPARRRPAEKGVTPVAMVRVDPVRVDVRTDWFRGVPREITWGDDRLPVTRVVAVRDERAAYPVVTGPRIVFEVETRKARFVLSYRRRSRRWAIEGMDVAASAA
jgi:hypothetical protein